MIKFTIIAIFLLLIVALGLLLIRIHQFNRPRTIRWQIGHQIFTFQFPFKWMHINSIDYFKDMLAMIAMFVIGILILAAVLFFLFLFIGLILPILVIVALIMIILFLIFVI